MRIILLTLLLSFGASAQWGLTGGLTLPSFDSEGTGSSTESYNEKLGFEFGGFYDYKVNSDFTVRGHLKYVGYNSEIFDSSVPVTGDISLRYIVFNPTVNYKLPSNFVLQAGLGVGFGDGDIKVLGVTVDIDSNIGLEVETITFINLGVGYDFGQARVNLFYEYFMNDAVKSTTSDYKMSVNALHLTVDYKF